jgi:hypothetical protein
MKCFFSLSASGWCEQFRDMSLALAASAKARTSLEMYCIYDGEPNAITAKLESMGVHMVFHKPKYTSMLEAGARRYSVRRGRTSVWGNPALWNGTFLRLEIPLLLEALGINDRFALYVDADCIFQRDPPLELIEPECLAAASEKDPRDKSHFNAGVMLLNVAAMQKSYPAFIEFCSIRGFVPKRGEGVVDQGLYNAFYGDKWLHISELFNWKAYWPMNPDAYIVHFHGPKPAQIAEFMRGKMKRPPSKSIGRLLEENSANLAVYRDVWEAWLHVASIGCSALDAHRSPGVRSPSVTSS